MQIPFLLLPKADIALVINVVFNFITSLAAIAGNLLIIYCIVRTPSLHSATNFLFLGLALSDIGVGFLIQPMCITTLIKVYNGLPLDCTFTAIYSITSTFMVTVSVLTITAISVDRYLAIRFNLRYQELVTERKVIYFQITLWMGSGVFTITRMAGYRIFMIFAMVVITVCLSSTCFAYSRIFMVLRRHQGQIRSQIHHHTSEQEQSRISNMAELRRSIINTFYVFFAFLFCFLPYFFLGIFISSTSYWNKAVMQLNLYATSLVLANSALNPVIYCCRRRELRGAAKQIFQTILC